METSSPSNSASPPTAASFESSWRWRCFLDLLLVFLCYCVGLILGTGLAAFLWLEGPEFRFNPLDFSGSIRLIVAGGLTIAASACILGVFALFTSSRWRARGPLFCILLGTSAPLIGLLIGDLANLWFFTHSPPPAWAQTARLWPILYAIPGIAAALLLLLPEPHTRWKQATATAAIAAICIVVFYLHGRLADSIYQQTLINYQPILDKIATWAKARFPQPSVNSEITLPPQFFRLPGSEGEQIQAILTPNGPVLILITTYQEISLSSGGPAIVYVNAPLTPNQFGTDSNGNPSIHVDGIWDHHVVKQLAPRLYLVELNEDPDQK
jgi:hypothetical protein